jgi:hypothetical protein
VDASPLDGTSVLVAALADRNASDEPLLNHDDVLATARACENRDPDIPERLAALE